MKVVLAMMLMAASAPAFAFTPGEDGLPKGWGLFQPNQKVAPTQYRLQQENTQWVVHAVAKSSMAGLISAMPVDLNKTPVLCWSWRIKSVVTNADLSTKAGDDYAARVYVLFDVPLNQIPFADRVKVRLAKTFYGAELPTAAINYVWDNKHPIGTVAPNSYTDRTRMMVLQSGNTQAGKWVKQARNVASDYRAMFSGPLPQVTGLAIATDTDNTNSSAEAWYSKPFFVSDQAQCQ
ncbi:MAG: DUF3047 domain-containing protein [Moraxellaceae bacterium]|nr:DUF3047 domain-containing protein [Moraxellaceae bacterium]MDZ4386447.1 DUF3047 domain-containing protein [Moraxellaceae bacterium]